MFRLMRNFWQTPDMVEPETHLKKRKGKNKKRKRTKILSSELNEENSPSDGVGKDILENNSENHSENDNLIESDETQSLINEKDSYEDWMNQNCYEIEIIEEQYKYMVENNLINDKDEFTTTTSTDFAMNKANDDEDLIAKNALEFEQAKEELKKKDKQDKWWLSDEEFDENFELTDEQKLKCAAFFIWIFTLIIFFYFHNPEPKNSKGSSKDYSSGGSSLDRIRDMARNRLPPGLLSQRNKFFPGLDDDPADHLSKYFDKNQHIRSAYDDSRFGGGDHRREAYDDEMEMDEDIEMNRRLKRKRKVQKTQKDGIKRILWFNESKMPNIYRNKKIFEYYGCEKKNCEFLTDRSKSRESNAIVFDYQDRLNSSDLPSRRKMQLFIFYSEDAPQIYENRNELAELKFNLSWSFTRDSSIQLRTGNLIFDQNLIKQNLKAQIKKKISKTKIKDCLIIMANACKTIRLAENSLDNLIEMKTEEEKVSQKDDMNDNGNISSTTNINYSSNENNLKSNDDRKKNRIQNIVNINNLGERFKLAQNLMTNYEQYLLNELNRLNDSSIQFDLLTNCSLSTSELKDLISNYRFVLIIENQMCLNYQTNYVYLALETTNTIPILNGNQYTNLPHNSIIDLNEYQKMTHLIDYLKILKSNFTKFYSHLYWKNYFKVSYKRNDLCELCEKLNQINFKNYKDLASIDFTSNTWRLNAACFTLDKF